MDLSHVGLSCHQCHERDLLPISCDVCFRHFCRSHCAAVQHGCLCSRVDLVAQTGQSMDACRRLATLMTRTVIPNATRDGDVKFRTLSLHSKALTFLPEVRGGLALLGSFGWTRDGDFLMLSDALDWRKSLASQERHFAQLLRQLDNVSSSKRVAQDFDMFLVLDFEATCQDGPEKIKPQEIIECECPAATLKGSDQLFLLQCQWYLSTRLHCAWWPSSTRTFALLRIRG